MDWILVLILIAIFIYSLYNCIVLNQFGIPKSLSMTFYLFKEKKDWFKIWFPIMMISLAFLLMPAWIEISEGSTFQFLAFLAPSAVIFTGIAPAFKSSQLENVVHMTGAICAAITSLLWIVLVTHLWTVILLWFFIIVTVMFLTKTIKTSYIYWLETVAFLSTFAAILQYYL